MEKSKICCYLLLSIVVVMMDLTVLAEDFSRFSYIIHVDKSLKPGHFDRHDDWYKSMVEDAYMSSLSDPLPLLYTYNIAMHGFAAQLTNTEAESLNKMNGILGVFQDSMNQLYTTRTPEFLGLSSRHGPWAQTGYGHDAIVGVLDSGVWPESESFSDQGMKRVPAKWKGKCEEGAGFNSSNCNKKLIGARFFLKGYEANMGPILSQDDYRSPRDSNGHGTHTSSTAVGSPVPGSSLLGFANGTARGMAPKARVAVYKVCWPEGCASSDILAGMETALSDGVDVLSLSIGGSDSPYYNDPIAIGAFQAAERGVFVSCSAGNSGPTPSDISNTAPWITTVGASTIDRAFPAPVTLGNGAVFPGSSLYKATNTSNNRRFPLVYAQTASNDTEANLCLPGSLDPKMVRRKIVLCDRGENGRKEKGLVVRQAGGVGMILANGVSDGNEVISDCHILPATAVGYNAAKRIKAYINGTRAPTATIELRGITVVRKVRAPVVAWFSSRGPNPIAPEILKPDLVAPGVDILAAWSKRNSPSELSSDKRRVAYNIVSGTSMSCPHVSGIAALIRGAHRTWSSAAIKSALMTSSRTLDNTKNSIVDSVTKAAATPFAVGAGHVNPPAAINPGLVYDLGTQDYVNFLCSLNYTKAQILILTKKPISCSRSASSSPGDLNYPSFSVVFKPGNFVENTKRTVTNVGEGPSVYELDVGSPANVKIRVEPKNLVFKTPNEKVSYSVRFETQIPATPKTDGRVEFGYVSWKCIKGGDHVVRSPVAVSWSAPVF